MCSIFAYQGVRHTPDQLQPAFASLEHRGPDAQRFKTYAGLPPISLGFHRLAIMDTSAAGIQPFEDELADRSVICNGEIYNYKQLLADLQYQPTTRSDVAVLLPLYARYQARPAEFCQALDGEFALVIREGDHLFAVRDYPGTRGMFIGWTGHTGIGHAHDVFIASEAKALHPLCDEVMPFPPGCYWDSRRPDQFVPYVQLADIAVQVTDRAQALAGIKQLLTAAVAKRQFADRPIGLLLSGGLDSSLVAGILRRLQPTQTLHTFSIGLKDSQDLIKAREVAQFLQTIHHEVTFTPEEGLAAMPEVIQQIESADITTVRATTPSYLLAKYIAEHTDIRVLYSGELSDELFGYTYTDLAPSAKAFQDESIRRVNEVHQYDSLRVDRSLSRFGIEVRFPFCDQDFIQFVLSIDPALKLNTTGLGKQLLRDAFVDQAMPYLPDSILYRPKIAFSDGTDSKKQSWIGSIKSATEKIYSDTEYVQKRQQYTYMQPTSKESLYYRELFERYYPNRLASWIPGFWLPKWAGDVSDPSARLLPTFMNA